MVYIRIWSYITDLTHFPDRARDFAVATKFRVKVGEIGLFTFIRRLGISKQSGILQFGFQKVLFVQKLGELWSTVGLTSEFKGANA